MNLIDYQDSRPIYEQIVENFKLQMYKGILRADDQMPSVRSLAVELSTNPNTVQKAYTELERQGFIYTVKGRGNFVKGNNLLIENKKAELIGKIIELIDEAADIGISIEEIMTQLTRHFSDIEEKGRAVLAGEDKHD